MDFLELAAQRYSVRSYEERPVEEEKLAQLLRAATLAPTAKNCQPYRIYVLQGEEALAKARKCSPLLYGAPLVLLFCNDVEDGFKTPTNEVNFGLLDVSIVATHVMLEAAQLGLGSVWVGYFFQDRIEQLFELPPNLKPVVMMPIGYAKPDALPSPKHTESKPQSELVIRL